MTTKVLLLVVSYLLGSTPSGVLVSKIWKLDIRQHGSGNIGATNVYRILGALAGGVVFTLDYLKGFLAASLGSLTGADPLFTVLLGFAVIIGHLFPVFLKFKGGKGAATGLGVLCWINPLIFIITLVFVLLVIVLTRFVSLASISAPALVCVLMYCFKQPPPYFIGSILIFVFIFFSHLKNIKRLLKGSEPRIGENK